MKIPCPIRCFAAFVALLGFSLSGAVARTVLFGISGSGGDNSQNASSIESVLYELDPSTGEVLRTVGPTGVTGISAMAVDPTTGRIFAWRRVSARFNMIYQFLELSPVTGAATEIALIDRGESDSIPDMAVGPDGTLYGWCENGDILVVIDKTNGNFLRFPDPGIGTSQTGLAFAPDGRLFVKYGVGVSRIDPATGASFPGTVDLEIPVGNPNTYHNILSFRPDGVAFTGQRRSVTGPTDIYAVNVDSGASTRLGQIPVALSALDFVDARPPAIKIQGKKRIRVKKAKARIRGTADATLPVVEVTTKTPRAKAKKAKLQPDGRWIANVRIPRKVKSRTVVVTVGATDCVAQPAPPQKVRLVRG